MEPLTTLALIGGAVWLWSRNQTPPVASNLDPGAVANTQTIQYSGAVPPPSAVFPSGLIPAPAGVYDPTASPVVDTGYIPPRTGVVGPSAVALGAMPWRYDPRYNLNFGPRAWYDQSMGPPTFSQGMWPSIGLPTDFSRYRG